MIRSHSPNIYFLINPIGNVSNSTISTIHRFFDSSPISPSNSYAAFTSMIDKSKIDVNLIESSSAMITLYDMTRINASNNNNNGKQLNLSKYEIIDSTLAWDSQVGAHVQWGKSDEQLLYNILIAKNNTNFKEIMSYSSNELHMYRALGVIYNPRKKSKKYLQCPIYHVSNNGLYAASPNLYKIKYTQKGYGINVDYSTPNSHALKTDGLYVINLSKGTCQLMVSLHDLAIIGGLDLHSVPSYGFHVKFSYDNKKILFVMRTLERYNVNNPNKTNRVQHLFVMDINGNNIKHVISWTSRPFIHNCNRSNNNKNSNSNNNSFDMKYFKKVSLRDGNHPNWIPGTHNISLNLIREVHAGNGYYGSSKLWDVIVINTDTIKLLDNYDIYNCDLRASTHNNHKFDLLKTKDNRNDLNMSIAYELGSGHPNFHNNNRYFITDAYEKEMIGLQPFLSYQVKKGSVPLRLIDVISKREVILFQAHISEESYPISNNNMNVNPILLFKSIYNQIANSLIGKEKSSSAWRCDMHPAWSRDFKWIAINVRLTGQARHVILLHFDIELDDLFVPTTQP
eukprot:gene8987-12121_t